MTVDRREFLKVATAGAALTLGAVDPTSAKTRTGKSIRQTNNQAPDIAVIGAGSFGMWTALNLLRQGASVTVIDPYGPGNSRQTSGGETRGVRTSYGNRRHGKLWTDWANQAIDKWAEWDEMGRDRLLPRLFYNTGDLILRDEMIPYLEDTQAFWDELHIPYELLEPEEVRYRWPWIQFEDLAVGLYEPRAGVVRARRAIESVAEVFLEEGGKLHYGHASLGEKNGMQLANVTVEPGEPISAGTYVFACGPWFPKVFPELMGKRLRIPMGHVFYFALPPGDTRFMYPNMPSYGVPGCTGWPALGRDHRGFRVRTGGRPPQDPDESDRWIDKEFHERPREILEKHFPDLVGAPISETRACHYESSVDGNWIIDTHPDFENVWLIGGGSSEGFKFGPVLGEYIAQRVLGTNDDAEFAEQFRLKEEEFEDETERNG